jgi:hypothetical protein
MWILIWNPFRIWGNLYKERCFLSQILSSNILFWFFGARECPIWITSNLGKFELNLEFIQTQHHAAWDYAARAGLSTDAAAQHYGRGPPVSPWVSLFVWHGDTRARWPGAIADRPEPPAAILGPLSFLLPPPCGAAIPIPPHPSPFTRVAHHPVPLSSELKHRHHPPFSAPQAHVAGLNLRTPCHPAGFGATIGATSASQW